MREGWLFMFTCVTLQFKVWRFTSDISHRCLFHCSSEPLNETSLSADFKHSDLKLPMQLGYYIFERNFEGRHQLLSQLFCIDVSCRLMYRQTSFAKICSFRIRFKFFLHHFFWFSLSTHKTFDMLLNFTASTITTSGINFLSLWIENFRNSCSKFLNFS